MQADIKDFIPTPGTIIVGDGHDWSAWLQHMVNGKGATHGCVVTYPDGSADAQMPMVLSAEYNGCVHVLWSNFVEDSSYNLWLYEIIGMSQKEKNIGLNAIEAKFLDVPYAYFAWPWFGWASLWNNVLNPLGKSLGLKWLYHDIDSENNWFTKNVFCTKQTWIFMDDAASAAAKVWSNLLRIIHGWMPDTFQPMQLKNMLIDNPTIFRLVAKRESGVFTIYPNETN